jgi:hypothetical protein
MSFKHRAFVESMVKMGKARPEYVPALKVLTKCYFIHEGIDKDIVAACTGLRPLVESVGSAPSRGPVVDYVAVLESVSKLGYPDLAKSVFDAYCITEGLS